jgi:hypothetical protein
VQGRNVVRGSAIVLELFAHHCRAMLCLDPMGNAGSGRAWLSLARAALKIMGRGRVKVAEPEVAA